MEDPGDRIGISYSGPALWSQRCQREGGSAGVSGGCCSLSPMERMGSGPWELKASVPEKHIEEVAQRTGWDPEE